MGNTLTTGDYNHPINRKVWQLVNGEANAVLLHPWEQSCGLNVMPLCEKLQRPETTLDQLYNESLVTGHCEQSENVWLLRVATDPPVILLVTPVEWNPTEDCRSPWFDRNPSQQDVLDYIVNPRRICNNAMTDRQFSGLWSKPECKENCVLIIGNEESLTVRPSVRKGTASQLPMSPLRQEGHVQNQCKTGLIRSIAYEYDQAFC